MAEEARTIDEKWEQYPHTVLEFIDGDRPRIDLRRPLGDGERSTLRRLGLELTPSLSWVAADGDDVTVTTRFTR